MIKRRKSKDGLPAVKKQSMLLQRILVLFVFFFVSVFVLSEVMIFAMYAVPLLSTFIANTQGVGLDSEWMLAVILWGFPTLFIVFLCTALHLFVIRRIYHKLRLWGRKFWRKPA